MKAYTVEVVDSLSLLSLKVASNVFDLSSGLHHVSIRDQIVRAQLAVRDLKRGDKSLHSLLIVGAGEGTLPAPSGAFTAQPPTILVRFVRCELPPTRECAGHRLWYDRGF